MAEVLENTRLAVFNHKDEFVRRIKTPDANGKIPHWLDNGEVTVYANPTLVHQHIQHVKNRFEQLKSAYIEQDAKARFLRQLVENDPPLMEIDHSQVERQEEANKATKAALKQDKQQCQQLQIQIDELTSSVCREHKSLTEKAARISALTEEGARKRARIEQLMALHKQLELPVHEDPELNLPLSEMKRLIKEYNDQTQQMTTNTTQAKQTNEQLSSAKRQLDQEIAELQVRKEKEQHLAEELAQMREKERAQGQADLEKAANWYRTMTEAVETATQISDFETSLTNDDNGTRLLTFKYRNSPCTVRMDRHGRVLTATMDGQEQECARALEQIQVLPPRHQAPGLLWALQAKNWPIKLEHFGWKVSMLMVFGYESWLS